MSAWDKRPGGDWATFDTAWDAALRRVEATCMIHHMDDEWVTLPKIAPEPVIRIGHGAIVRHIGGEVYARGSFGAQWLRPRMWAWLDGGCLARYAPGTISLDRGPGRG